MNKIHIIGGGITGCTLSHFLSDHFEVHLYEKENHLGGLAATMYNLEGVPYQMGSHILHTNEAQIVNFLKQFIDLEDIVYNVAIEPLFDLRYYDFPFTPSSLDSMPWHWREAIMMELEATSGDTAKNLRDLIVNFYGESAFHQFFESWIKKWFGKGAGSLDVVDWFRRYLRPIEYHGFYSETFQMFPKNIGWNPLFEKLTQNANVHLNTRVVEYDLRNEEGHLIITGDPSEFFGGERLEYTSMSFDVDSAQYAENKPDTIIYPNHVPFISITQFGKMFPKWGDKNTVVKDFPNGDIICHPVPRRKNYKLLERIKEEHPNATLAGRIGSYQFLDIADCIKQAMVIASKIKHTGVS